MERTDPDLKASVKNDHLNFEILYIFNGTIKKYRPDYIVRMKTGAMGIIETKGKETE